MLRVLLFVGTNLAVLMLLNIVIFVLQSVFHIRLGGTGSLLVMAGTIGMGGAFISLAMSKWIAKMTTGAHVIEQPRDANERWLVDAVRRHAEKAGIGMPEVAIYDGPEMNAFATGMSRNKALVAVSTGLLRDMDREQVDAVLGHEVSHIANGDMVTMTLLQGVLNTFVIFLARIVGSFVDSWLRGSRDSDSGGVGIGYYVTVIALEIVFGLFASMIVMWFSRRREFRADAGGANLAGRAAMISALQRLAVGHGENTLPKAVQAFGIAGAMGRLFASHPPIEERIAALSAGV